MNRLLPPVLVPAVLPLSSFLSEESALAWRIDSDSVVPGPAALDVECDVAVKDPAAAGSPDSSERPAVADDLVGGECPADVVWTVASGSPGAVGVPAAVGKETSVP